MPTVLHSCGRSRFLVDLFSEETDLDCINPLEMPPMGDCLLAEVKAARGSDLSLMGNATPEHLSRSLKRRFGASPGELRRRVLR